MEDAFKNTGADSNVNIFPLGDTAVVLEFGMAIDLDIHRQILAVCQFLDEFSFDGFIEYVPAFTTVTVFYDVLISDYPTTEALLREMMEEIKDMGLVQQEGPVIEIPVLYGAEQGPDLGFVVKHTGMTEEAVIKLHTSAYYLVYMIGFAPGFPYLGGMDERIAVPRKHMPRSAVPGGSVGIAGLQTGIYPMETPGGWQIIGQTPLDLFDVSRTRPALLKAGDRVKFVAIDALEFDFLKGDDNGY